MKEEDIYAIGHIISFAFLVMFLYGSLLKPSMFCFTMTKYNEHWIEIPMLIFAVVFQFIALWRIKREQQTK